MSRSTQHIGLSHRALNFLKANECNVVFEYPMTEGMFDEEIKGRLYIGKLSYPSPYSLDACEYETRPITICEIVQATPWRSGMQIFTCLVNVENGERIGEWTEKEMCEY